MWDEKRARRFFKEWEGVRGKHSYLALSLYSLVPFVAYIRPRGMPSLFGSVNDIEDIAECNCYGFRYNWNLEHLKGRDEVLLRKLKVVRDFTKGYLE